MKDQAAFWAQTVASPVAVVHLALIKMQTSEALKRARKRTRPSIHTLSTSCFQNLPSIASDPPLSTTVPAPRIALSSLFLPQGSGIEIERTSRPAHVSLSSSTSLLGIAAISISGRPTFFPFGSEPPLFCAELRTISSCIIPRTSIW